MSQQTIEKPQFSDLSEREASTVNGGCNYSYQSYYPRRYRRSYSRRRYSSVYYGYSYPRYSRSYSYVSYSTPVSYSYNCY